MTSLDHALQECVERERDSCLKLDDEDAKKSEVEKEKKLAEDIRSKALETFAETRKRKIGDREAEGTENKKQKRNQAADATLSFLREKMVQQKETEERNLELRKKDIELREQQQESFMEMFRTNMQQQKEKQQLLQQQMKQQQDNMMAMMTMMMEIVKTKTQS